MKMLAVCAQCIITAQDNPHQNYEADYFDDHIAYVECRLEHKSAMIVQNCKAEILLGSAADALSRGFTFEAVASAATALERSYEFSLQVFMATKGKTTDEFDVFFKGMSSQSERQLGAFMLLSEMDFGATYKPSQDMTSFRNSVIHRGKVPTSTEAEQFCSHVYDTIRSIKDQLIAKYSLDAIARILNENVREKWLNLPKGMPHCQNVGLSILSFSSPQSISTFKEAMDTYLYVRQMRLR
jgi:hypothetical protein